MKKLLSIILVVHTLNPAMPQKMPKTRIARFADVHNTGVLDKGMAFDLFRKEIKSAAEENEKIPKKDNSIFRIMSYNVHFWQNPEATQSALKNMMHVIATVNPDILILQEVSPNEGFAQGKYFLNSRAFNELQKLGFTDFSACNTVQSGWFGNVIASKKSLLDKNRFAFVGQRENSLENRCYSLAQTRLSTGDDLYVYGTHLEVRDNGTIRLAQVSEIIQRIQWELPNSNVLLAADFNATRSSGAIQLLQQNGYQDCFTYMGWHAPTFTSWAGTEIDFIFLSPKWDLPLAGCYVYFDAASDHLPVIMDIELQRQPETSKIPTRAPRGDQHIKPDTNFLEELLQTLQRDFIWLAQVFNP